MNQNRPTRASECGGAWSKSRQRAFTLVELLTVMAVIAVVLAVLVPAVKGPSRAADLTRSVYLFSGVLERAHADAMARNAYRYVAVEPATVSGNAVVFIKTLGCRNGARFSGVTPASAPFALLDAKATLNRVQIANLVDYPPSRAFAERNLAQLPSVPASPSQPGYRFDDGQGLFKQAYLFECAPNGGVALVDTLDTHTLCHWIEADLQPTRGTSVDTANYAIVQVSGLTGQTRVYRP